MSSIIVAALFILIAGNLPAFGQYPVVVNSSPQQNALSVPITTDIMVQFNMSMDTSSFSNASFVVYASCTGVHEGTFDFFNNNMNLIFNPLQDFMAGEVVTVVITANVYSDMGEPMSESHVWNFTTKAEHGLGHIIADAEYTAGTPTYPSSIYAADLDNDGDLDLVTANAYGNNISVIPNNGDGTYSSSTNFAAGTIPVSVVAFELNNIGALDVAVADWGSDSVKVFYNMGDGFLLPHSQHLVGATPAAIAAADLNGDGNVDLVTTNRDSHNISVLINQGGEDFAPAMHFPIGGSYPRSIYVFDYDNDGLLDIVTANSGSHNITFMRNMGEALFTFFGTYDVGNSPISVFAANLDGNRFMDIAVSTLGDNSIWIILRDTVSFEHSTKAVGVGPRCVFASDIDGDDDLDLITANNDSSRVSVLLNSGTGSFAPHAMYSTGPNPMSVYAADLDNDGDIDLSTANYFGENISVVSVIPLIVVSWGPVDILVEDPGGLRFGYDSTGSFVSEIYPAEYYHQFWHDSLIIFEPLLGPYSIYFYADTSGDTLPRGNVNAPIDEYSAIIKVDGTQNATVVTGSLDKKPRGAIYVYPYIIEEGYHYVNGDANRDEIVNVADAVYIINYVFKNGPPPYPVNAGDANCDGIVNVADAVYLINFIFKNGPPPCYFEI